MIDRRKVLFTLITLLSLLTAFATPAGRPLPVHAATGGTPQSVTVAGDFQAPFCGGNTWQPDCAATHMTAGPDGIWRLTLTLQQGDYNYKAVIDDAWSNGNYGLHATPDGPNIPLHIAANNTAVTFYYDPDSHWITDNINSLIVTAAGSFQHLIGCPSDWQPSCLKSWMEDIQGTGTYTYKLPANIAASYPAHFEFKAALNESWTTSYGVGGGSANVPFDLNSSTQYAVLSFNGTSHVPVATVKSLLPGHDNNVEYDGLAHDSRNRLYRVPFGAVTPGTPVMLRFRTFHDDVTGVTIRLYDTSVGHEDREPMSLVARNVDCYDKNLTAHGYTCDYWQYTYTPRALGTVYYRFIAVDGTATAYYADTPNRYDGLGVATPDEQDNGFRLNVVASNFKIVPWMQNGVMYQIFPDRFYNGNRGNDPSPTDPRYAYPAPANATPQQQQAAADAQIQIRAWNQLPEGYCRGYDHPATPCTETPKGRDYFGGDLQGIADKLDYLKHLGITILYLNPIFESGSNHGYDTRDYLTVSRYFGGNKAFRRLVEEADDRGIRIILDGVFNHLSSDSPFFDRYHHYTTVGACESVDSPYRSWFTFHDVAPGTGVCVDSHNRPNSATYDGWAGFDSIPVITKKDPTDPSKPYAPVANYFYADPVSSVAGYWLHQGASGWRFDVMTDPSFPPAYWQQVRTITKGIKPDETLIAEAWHWYDNLPLTHGDMADTAMGYRFRNAVLGLLGATDDKGFPQENDPTLGPSVFATRIMSMREDYADATWYTFQNLLDSHDTRRVLWSLTPGQNNREDKEFNAANVATGKQRQRIAALVQMTMPGTPTIYYGDEVALTGDDDPDNRRPFPWQLRADGRYAGDTSAANYYGAAGDHTMFDWYHKLIAIRAKTPVLRQGKLTFLLADDTAQTLAYAMRSNDALAITVINRNESVTQTVTVPTAGYLRDDVTFDDALGAAGSVTTANSSFAVTLAPLSAAIFVMRPGQDITGPVGAGDLSATAQNDFTSTVTLRWSGVPDAATYNVYRSPVQGGGYVRIGTTTGTTYADTSVANGQTYYYVVRGADSLGNEGDASNEASATPAYPIGYAVLQWPKTISETIQVTPTTVYGQVYIHGLTDANADPATILAQVGYGAQGSDPATWTTWRSMSYNPGHTGDNNYEYMGSLRPDATGTYDYLVRFSDDGGRSWIYGDQDGYVPGQNSGTNQPGVLTVTPSADTTAPSAPVASIDWSASSLTVSWTPSSDPDDAIGEYRIFRGTAPGREDTTPIATVSGTTTSYVDTAVNSGQTYYYVVRAYDTALNASAPSNEVSHTVEPKMVAVTFRVKVPGFTPPGDVVYISGYTGLSPDPLCNYCGGGTPATAMTETAPGSHIWQTTIAIPDGTQIQYKYTRGSYNTVEEWGSIKGYTNRVATVHANSATDLTQTFDDTSDTNPDDNHKAVQNWRDALVTGTTPAANATGPAPASVAVSFNWDVTPEGTDFSNAITVMKGSTAIAGTISHDSATQSLTFMPSAPLSSGTYTVTVDHVVPVTPQNDGIKIQTPYTFSFTVS